MTEFWSKIVDEVSIKRASYRWDTYNNPINEIKEPCLNLWSRMYIWHDGKVNPCDTDYKSYLSVGSAKENSIKELWNSEKYIKLRNLHIKKHRGKIEPCDAAISQAKKKGRIAIIGRKGHAKRIINILKKNKQIKQIGIYHPNTDNFSSGNMTYFKNFNKLFFYESNYI